MALGTERLESYHIYIFIKSAIYRVFTDIPDFLRLTLNKLSIAKIAITLKLKFFC